MRKIVFLWIIILLFLVPAVFADGTCTLDKAENYHPGETALFSCACTTGIEQNAAGFMVWRNSSGIILRNVSTNSGSCITSLFTDSFLFPSTANYSGNATFETTSVNWDDAGDVVSDTFNVTGAGILDCIISNVTGSTQLNLGELGSVKIIVEDGITNNPLIHVSCQAEGYDIGGNPILFEPYGPGESARFTTSDGEVGFQHLMTEKVWETSTTYLYEFHCACLPNSTDSHECYDEMTGIDVGFKTCTSQVPFTTGDVDNRDINEPLLPLVITIFVVMCGFGLLGFAMTNPGIKLFGYGIALIEMLFLVFMLYVSQQQESLIGLLRINFYVMLTLSFGIGMIALSMYVFSIMKITDDKDDEGRKWQN